MHATVDVRLALERDARTGTTARALAAARAETRAVAAFNVADDDE